ncbi:MAG: cytidylate kinase-like family protein [Ktedonobacteraceae bacterium]|nr:cytidylate kinase-like family protein [Ktedonobacteraceae bacterium]
MTEKEDLEQRMCAITISREYGSGGGEIARGLAERLNWQLFDHRIIQLVAQRLGINEEEAEVHDERAEGFVERLIDSMQYALPQPPLIQGAPTLEAGRAITDAVYQQALQQVLVGAASLGHVVIVGRGAQILLASRRDVLHIRIVAPFEKRVAYVMRRENLTAEAARNRIRQKEAERERALKEQFHMNPYDAHLYDLIINTGILALTSVVEMIYLALRQKAERLSLPEEELGPGAGLARYPGRPADFQSPGSEAAAHP